ASTARSWVRRRSMSIWSDIWTAYARFARLRDGADVRRLQALRALHHFELHPLAFDQRAEAFRLDGSVVAEDVLATAVLRDEAEALRIIEPLHFTSSHFRDTSFVVPARSLRPEFRTAAARCSRTGGVKRSERPAATCSLPRGGSQTPHPTFPAYRSLSRSRA